MKLRSTGPILLCLATSTSMAFAAGNDPNVAAPMVMPFGFSKTIPFENWKVDSASFIQQLKSTRHGPAKAATDRATVYRPVPVCRLIDTRGNPAAIAIAGPLAANSTTNVNSAGFCGIPNNGEVAGISLSFHVFNTTVNNGGYISFLQQGAAISGTNAVFNPGAQWTAATANVSIPNDSGNFEIYIAQSVVHVIVDVNGYYQDLDSLDVGTQELDINGNTGGDLFQLTNSGSGSALTVSSSTGQAITVNGGTIRSAGAGVGTGTFAFIHQVNTSTAFGAGAGTICGGFPEYTVIDHPMLNGDPSAIILMTPRDAGATSDPANGTLVVFYFTGGCTPNVTGFWGIHNQNGVAQVNGSQFNLMVIKP